MNILLKNLEAAKQRINPKFDRHKKWISNHFFYQIIIKQNIVINISHHPLQEKPITTLTPLPQFPQVQFNFICALFYLLF